jgi:hypothetical protein
LPLGFDSVVLERGSRNYQILKLTNHSEVQGSPEPMVDMESTSRGGGGGNSLRDGSLARDGGEKGGDRNDDKKSTPPNERPSGSGGGDDRGAGKAPNGKYDTKPSGKDAPLSVVKGKGKTRTPEVVLHSSMKVHIPRLAATSISSRKGSPPTLDTLLQKFAVHAVVGVDVSSQIVLQIIA